MSKPVALPYSFQWSSTHPHIAWADIYNNGVLAEVAVMALDEKNGDLYFIPISILDSIDTNRLIKIINKRDAQKYPLWDLMASTTLMNGLNALEYFNQLVKVRSISGQIFSPGAGRRGSGNGLSRHPNTHYAVPEVEKQVAQGGTAVSAQPTIPAQQKKGPGRPPAVRQ